MRIQIIRNANGFGLERDGEVLASVLTGHEIHYGRPAQPAKGTFDINFHLEHILARNVASAPINIAVPNPEWCSRPMYNTLDMFTAVYAKTRDSERIFTKLNRCPTYYTGWTSPDLYDPTVERVRKIVHIAGLSPLKSTHACVEAMSHLPNINGTCYYRRGSVGNTPNFEHIKKPQTAEHIRREINAAGIHLLPSQYEGYCHVLHEAMSCGATVITTDHPPMNTFGAQYHVKVTGTHAHNLADIAHLDPTDLRNKIQQAWDQWKGFDPEARNAYLVRDRLFRARFAETMELTLQKQAA